MKMKGFSIQKICILVGICLLVGAIVILALWRWNINNSEKRAQYYVNTLQELIPDPQNAALEERRDNTMSVLSVDGTDFVGIVEFPRYESALPVCADWGKTSQYPCHFRGSIYDSTMQVGATTQKGQYDFYRDLSVGDTVLFSFEDNQRLRQNEYWPLIPFIVGFILLWWVYIFFSIRVGRNPERYSKKVIRLFFKDGYVH